MSDLRDLYQQVILDHSKSPRHFGKPPRFNRHAEGTNPLCGDQYTVYLRTEGDAIQEAAFTGSGCAISKASASMLTDQLRGKTVREAELMFDHFHRLVTREMGKPYDAAVLGKLEAFQGVAEFPARVKCATLAWHAMRAALKGDARASTE